MTTKQIEYILELAQTLNFNQAAENLFISQPTMTYQIKAAEEEIGFKIFERSGKGAFLTPAGFQFCITLRNIRAELNAAIEQGQNFSRKYTDDISIGVSVRSALLKLPEAMKIFEKEYPKVSITPKFYQEAGMDNFLNHELDIVFTLEENTHRIPDIDVHKIYESGFYLITNTDDPLAKKSSIALEDLSGRTLMIGGGSPPKLKALQQKIIHTIDVDYFNSQNHDTTLTNVAADRGVCIAPGFLNDETNAFAWTKVDYDDSFSCVLCTHTGDQRECVQRLIEIIQSLYH